MARAKVYIDSRFREYAAGLEKGIDQALGRTASVVTASARSTSTPYRIGDVLSKIKPTSVEHTRRRSLITVVAPDPKSLWFERGTYAKRGRARSSRAKQTVGSRGVKPVRFLRSAMKPAKLMLVENLKRSLR